MPTRRILALTLVLPIVLLLTLPAATSSHAQVVINEIMYHPHEPWPADQPSRTTNETEYIELYNTGTSVADLSDYRFDNGVSYNFPSGTMLAPGAYVVICENKRVFTNSYPDVIDCLGNFRGGLSNGGERLKLSRRDGTNGWVTVHTIEYIDGGQADGRDKSLELVNPGFARLRDQFYGAWADSTTVSGTPGRVNSVYDSSPPPVVGNVEHDPPQPFPGSSVTISARAAAHDSDLLFVTLQYRKDASIKLAWNEARMYDDGEGDDATTGDGIYTVQIPKAGGTPMQNGETLEFRIRAVDFSGNSLTAPAENTAGVPAGPYSYLCYFGEDTGFDGEYAAYHILMTQSNRTLLQSRGVYSDVLLDSTFITADGRIFYNCGVRYRGGSSRLVVPRNFRVEFSRGPHARRL